MTYRDLLINCPNADCSGHTISVKASLKMSTAKYGKPILVSVDYPPKAPCCGAILTHMAASVYDAAELALVSDDEH